MLPGVKGKAGHPADDSKRFINAVQWHFCKGAPWWDLPADYGHWKSVNTRFCRWRDRGVGADLFEELSGKPGMERLMVDASHIKLHPHAVGAKGGTRPWQKQKAASIQNSISPLMLAGCP